MYMPVTGAPLLIEERKGEEEKNTEGKKKLVKLRGFIEVFLTLKAPQRTVRLGAGCPRDWERETERERETLVWYLALHAAAV